MTEIETCPGSTAKKRRGRSRTTVWPGSFGRPAPGWLSGTGTRCWAESSPGPTKRNRRRDAEVGAKQVVEPPWDGRRGRPCVAYVRAENRQIRRSAVWKERERDGKSTLTGTVTTARRHARGLLALQGKVRPSCWFTGRPPTTAAGARSCRRLEERFAVCAVDRRGRGGSDDSEDYAIEREFEDVAAVVDSLRRAGGPAGPLLRGVGGARGRASNPQRPQVGALRPGYRGRGRGGLLAGGHRAARGAFGGGRSRWGG